MPFSSPPLQAELEGRPPGVAEGDWRGIRAAYEAARHEIKPVEDGRGGFKAWNPGQGWTIGFDARGFEVKPQQGCWSWGLEMLGVAADPLDATIKERGSRIEFQRGDGVTEWFVNDLRGLEQGWTLAQPLADSAIQLRVRGGLVAAVEKERVSFGGELSYGGLKAWDAQGRTVPVWFEAGARADEFAVRFDDRGAQYPLTIDPLAQNAFLKASNPVINGDFGRSVAISGDTLVIGAPGESSAAVGVNGDQSNVSAVESGAAYVFVRQQGIWVQQAYLKASNTDSDDNFGQSVAIDGDMIVIGAPEEDGNGTNATGNPSSNAVSNSGAVYVFQRSGGNWAQTAYLKATSAVVNLRFGSSVATHRDWIVVGAPNDPGAGIQSGAAFVYVRSGSSWLTQKLTAANAEAGDLFGTSVGIHDLFIVVGAPGEDSNSQLINSGASNNSASNAGAAYVFARDGLSFVQGAYLKAANSGEGDHFGRSVAISGDTVIVGAPLEDSNARGVNGDPNNNAASDSGACYVFKRNLASWTQQAYLKAVNSSVGDEFGHSVAISNDVVLVGAYRESSNATGVNGNPFNTAASNLGAAYVFLRNLSAWTPYAYLKPSNTSTLNFGLSVAVSNDTVIVGNPREGGVTYPWNLSALGDSGAAYVFDLWHTSLSKTAQAVVGVQDARFGRLGEAVLANSGEVMWRQGLTGAGSSGGRNTGLFSTLAPGRTTADVLLQAGSPLAGVNLPLNAIARGITQPLVHRTGEGLFTVTASGSGLNAANNRILMVDTGLFTRPIFRTGEPQFQLGNAAVSRWHSLRQARNEDAIQMVYQLASSNLATVSKTADSGLLVMSHTGSIQSNVASREGQPAYGGVGRFGQFGSLSAAAGSSTNHVFVVPLIPDSPGPSLPTLFWRTTTGSFTQAITSVGATVLGAPGTTIRAFTGLSTLSASLLSRVNLAGAPRSTNEALLAGNSKIARKGEDAAAGGAVPDNTPGVTIARLIRFWPVDVADFEQVVIQVQLTGTGVTARNNQALILIQNNVTRMMLARTGDPVEGIPGATLRKILAVDVNPVSGHYALVASLAGVPAGRNQALLTGHTQLGNNFSPLRKPQPRLQKGGYYTSFHTPRGFIRSLALKPPVSPTGAGGIGLGQVVSASGQVLVEVTLDGRVVELVHVRR